MEDKWFYPICGYKEGWCGSEEGCIEKDNKPSFSPRATSSCKYYIREHPKMKITLWDLRQEQKKC